MRATRLGPGLLILMTLWPVSAAGAAPPPAAELVSFAGPDGQLHGFLYRPAGDGPFPAILWNHGSERLPGWQPELAAYFTSKGFVFFIPHRSGQGRSPGRYIMDRAPARATPRGDRAMLEAHGRANLDVTAAAAWLLRQPFVDPARAAMVGCSFGGIQTLLSAERGLGFKAFVAFAPAAISWGDAPLQARLREAVARAKAPVLILQAENDYSTEPTRILGPLAVKGGGAARVYPAFGATPQDGHWAFATTEQGAAIWGAEVLEFLRLHLR
jgi:dienelactone hydrolase